MAAAAGAPSAGGDHDPLLELVLAGAGRLEGAARLSLPQRVHVQPRADLVQRLRGRLEVLPRARQEERAGESHRHVSEQRPTDGRTGGGGGGGGRLDSPMGSEVRAVGKGAADYVCLGWVGNIN